MVQTSRLYEETPILHSTRRPSHYLQISSKTCYMTAQEMTAFAIEVNCRF